MFLEESSVTNAKLRFFSNVFLDQPSSHCTSIERQLSPPLANRSWHQRNLQIHKPCPAVTSFDCLDTKENGNPRCAEMSFSEKKAESSLSALLVQQHLKESDVLRDILEN